MNTKIKKVLKKSRFIRRLHAKIVDDYAKQKKLNFAIDEITPIYSEPDIEYDKLRFNIAIPTLKREFVFGGITTALNFFFKLSKEFDQRIILTDSDVHNEDIVNYQGFSIVVLGKKSHKSKQIIACNDRQYTKLNIAKNDIFIATSWWSAYILLPVIEWQNKTFNTKHKLIYLIQDYEPGFYPWSSRFLLADSTYTHSEDTIAVFNTKLLKDFLNNKGYHFYREYYFEPVLNKELMKSLNYDEDIKKEKKLIVYGRPAVDRNCFEIIVGTLKYLLEVYPDSEKWEFISLGESHAPVQLNDRKQLIAKGKVSLEEYASIMKQAYVGISLMVSPHPSYPPLEMSAFKIKTITNTYANKDLNDFSNYIISLKDCSYKNIAEHVEKVMKEFPKVEKNSIKQEYLSVSTFDEICEDIEKEILYAS